MAEVLLPTRDEIKVVASEFIDGFKGSVEKLERDGGESTIFVIDDKYILRVGSGKATYDVEHAVIDKARAAGVKVPETLASNFDLKKYPFAFSLQSKLSGVPLGSLAKSRWKSIYEEVGHELAKLYAVKLDGFGQIDIDKFRENGVLKGGMDSWKNYIYGSFLRFRDPILRKITTDKKDNFRSSKLTKVQAGKVIEIAERVNEIDARLLSSDLNLEQASLLHGDLQRNNFMVSDGHLSGIIDFEHILVGDYNFDLAVASLMPGGNELYEVLVKSSGFSLNMERFYLYRMAVGFGKIYTRYVKGDYLHENDEILGYVLQELNR